MPTENTEPTATTTEGTSADPKVASSGAEPASSSGQSAPAAGTAASASPSGAKPPVDMDKLLESAAKASNSAKEATKRAEVAEKLAKDLQAKAARADALDSKKTSNVREAIRDLIGEGYSPQKIIEELALDVEVPTDVPVADLVKAELKKAKDAEEAARVVAEAAKTAERATAKEAEFKAIQNEYLKEVDAFTDLPENAAKFPLAAAWVKKVTPALVLDTFKALVKAGQPCEPPDVMAKIEAGFQEEIDATPFGRQKPAPTGARTYQDEIDEQLERLDALQRAQGAGQEPIKRADPSIPVGQPVPTGATGKSVHDENMELLDKWDRENDPRRRLGAF